MARIRRGTCPKGLTSAEVILVVVIQALYGSIELEED